MKKSKAKKTVKAKKKVSKAKRSVKAKVSPFYAQSKRLGFRLLQEGDEELYVGLFTDAKTMEFVMPPLSKERAERSFKKALEVTREKPFRQHISAIVERATKKAIGITSLKMVDAERRRAEGGVLLKPTAHAQRFAAEAVQATSKEAFKWHTIDELSAQVPAGHKVGERLVTGIGFTQSSESSEVVAGESLAARKVWLMTRESWARNTK